MSPVESTKAKCAMQNAWADKFKVKCWNSLKREVQGLHKKEGERTRKEEVFSKKTSINKQKCPVERNRDKE